ncbi:GNAT family N-acetyltransferase [Candidatus Saccharibacteria bacterium]|nr:GNAT family N-acetyltransferase [Candidatus Saccharibacteria bacterium]
MSMELYTFSNLPHELQQQFAAEISTETNSQFGVEQKIVPVTMKAILQRGIGVVALQDEALAGYVGVTNMYNGHAQVGTLVVPEHAQGSGVGKLLVANVTEHAVRVDLQPFAFCNPSSRSSFEAAGYTPALPGALPPEAHSQFNNQPMIYPRS